MKKRKWTVQNMGDQTGRTAVVTGANAGIGFETAKALAEKGAKVVLACRNAEKGRRAVERIAETVEGGRAEFAELDLSRLESVQAFATRFKEENDRLDILVNNAGVMMPPYGKTVDGFEIQFGVNHLGHFALTGWLLPLLRKTPGARIVTVSSAAHNWGEVDFDDLSWETRQYKKMAAYGQSKLANLMFTYELQRRLAAAGADTLALASHPGWTATDLQRHTRSFRLFNPLFAMKPWQGALPTLFAATASEARGGEYYGPDGWMEMKGYPKVVASNEASRDRAAAGRLFDVSEELTGVRFGLEPEGEGLSAVAG
jgi:NAD(P)-dependent dehydrogenase (short-subunit alcohol dehydrogenase family)